MAALTSSALSVKGVDAGFARRQFGSTVSIRTSVPQRAIVCRRRAVVATATAQDKAKKIIWADRRELLLKNQIRSVPPEEAAELVKKDGYVILDVRPEGDFKEAHPEGAVGVELYRLIKGWSADKIIRRAAFLFFGVLNGTEENPAFIQEVEEKLPKNSKIIVACSPGGTLRPTPSLPGGKESRSLIAAYRLYKVGYKGLTHLEGGTYEYFKRDLPAVYQEE